MREYFLISVVAAVFTFVATPLARWAAIRFGAVTQVRARDVHAVPIPRLGGTALFIGFAAATLVSSQLPYLSQIFGTREAVGTLIAAGMMCALGAWDDFAELNWAIKFGGQALAACVLVVSGVQFLMLPLGEQTVLPTPFLVVLSVFVILVIVNAVNWVDGLDGLAAGMVAIASASFFFYAYQQASASGDRVFSTSAFISAATVGACAGFLPHNFHPARLFMGDAGSLLLGTLMASATISFAGNLDPAVVSSAGDASVAFMLPLLVPLAILAVPLWDFAASIVRRIRSGQKPWEADGRHLHHRMLQIGHTHRAAVLILYLWSIGIALGLVSMAYWPVERSLAALIGLTVLAFALTWGLPRWRRRRAL